MVTTIVSKAEVILLIPISRQSQVADIRLRALICVVAIFIAGCQTKSSDATMEAVEHEEMITSLLRYREMIDSSFRSDSNSPFQQDSNVHFSGIKWFPPETAYRTESILYRNERPETVLVYGTKGDERRLLKYGYFLVSIEGKQLRVNAYKQVAD